MRLPSGRHPRIIDENPTGIASSTGTGNMRIDRLRMQNFKCFEDHPLELDPRFTLLVGDNGAGKTTILDALAVAAGIWLVRPPDSMLASSGRNILRNEIRLAVKQVGDRRQFVERKPVSITATGEIAGQQTEWCRQIRLGGSRTTNAEATRALRIVGDHFSRDSAGENIPSPVIAYYGAGRAWLSSRARSSPGLKQRGPARRWEAFYPRDDSDVPPVLRQTPGMVLIDEIDVHLHPKWQRRVVRDLKETFPKIQFVCTSHSPFVIQSLEAGELRTLDRSGPPLVEYANRSIEDIAEDIQDVAVPQQEPQGSGTGRGHRTVLLVVARRYGRYGRGAAGSRVGVPCDCRAVLGQPRPQRYPEARSTCSTEGRPKVRPVERGTSPREYSNYRDAIGDLEERLGKYCSYCERRLPASLRAAHRRQIGVDRRVSRDGNFMLRSGRESRQSTRCRDIEPQPPVTARGPARRTARRP